jgi:hypothetical protein
MTHIMLFAIEKEEDMAREESTPEVTAVPTYQEELRSAIKKVVAGACRKKDGLVLPVGMRGHEEVNETLCFKAGSLEDVIVRSDFTFVLVLQGKRYWLQSRESNCAAILQIRNYVGAPKDFNFPPGISFNTSAHEEELAGTA